MSKFIEISKLGDQLCKLLLEIEEISDIDYLLTTFEVISIEAKEKREKLEEVIKKERINCLFCNKNINEVDKMIEGPEINCCDECCPDGMYVYICNQCIIDCLEELLKFKKEEIN
ncbi:MAG: ClpX C4-type zinc finger protein [Thermotogota bacterium]|nr:ClpX C4-type zinc finger protein [Thermotogota bacterium]